MTDDERGYVSGVISNEGLHYAFDCYSDFGEIQDPEFHRLRTEYLRVAKELEDYIGPEQKSE